MQPIQFGPLTLAQANGSFTISIDDSLALGGGSVAGVVSAQGKASIVVNELIIAKAGIAALSAQIPALAPFLVGALAAIDAAIAGL